jgi:hypothetical protein
MSFTSRQVDKLVLSRAQREGVGATVRRSIGGGEVSAWSFTTGSLAVIDSTICIQSAVVYTPPCDLTCTVDSALASCMR